MFKLIQKINVVLILILLILPLTVRAEANTAAQATTEREAEAQEKLDSFVLFFTSSVDNTNYFAEFDDFFFSQNQCRRQDIYTLGNQRDKTATALRKSILNPQATVADVKELQSAYEAKSAEIYYVRNSERLTDPDAAFTLNQEIRQLYPNNLLIKDALPQWQTQYTKKQQDVYANCQATWADLGKTWREFVNDAGTALDDFGTAISETTATIKETPGAIKQNLKDTGNGIESTLRSIPDLFSSDPEVSIGANNIALSRNISLSQKEVFQNLATQQQFIAQDSAARSVVSRNPNVSIQELIQTSVSQDNNTSNFYQDLLDQKNLEIKVSALDGAMLATWQEAQATNSLIADFKTATNPKGDVSTSITTKIGNIAAHQCRSGL